MMRTWLTSISTQIITKLQLFLPKISSSLHTRKKLIELLLKLPGLQLRRRPPDKLQKKLPELLQKRLLQKLPGLQLRRKSPEKLLELLLKLLGLQLRRRQPE